VVGSNPSQMRMSPAAVVDADGADVITGIATSSVERSSRDQTSAPSSGSTLATPARVPVSTFAGQPAVNDAPLSKHTIGVALLTAVWLLGGSATCIDTSWEGRHVWLVVIIGVPASYATPM
jgi:hypothetical protein